jgi:hypothetical protein
MVKVSLELESNLGVRVRVRVGDGKTFHLQNPNPNPSPNSNPILLVNDIDSSEGELFIKIGVDFGVISLPLLAPDENGTGNVTLVLGTGINDSEIHLLGNPTPK